MVYGKRAADPSAPYYVCARYPVCDSYVAAHRRTCLPMGTLADGSLRRKRIQAHTAFNRLWEDGLMSKRQAYLWLQAKLDLPEQETHIGRFSEFRCEQVTQLCSSFFTTGKRAA